MHSSDCIMQLSNFSPTKQTRWSLDWYPRMKRAVETPSCVLSSCLSRRKMTVFQSKSPEQLAAKASKFTIIVRVTDTITAKCRWNGGNRHSFVSLKPTRPSLLALPATTSHTDGNLHHRLYTKPASKQLTLHYRSHHPTATKKNLIRNELRRATLCSSTDNRHVSLTKTQNKLQRNGYPHSWIHEKKTKKPKRTSQQNRRPTPLTLNLPFISDTFNHNVRRILDRHNIPARLTNRRSTTILQLATKTNTPNTTCRSKTCPSPTICQLTNVVYEATCTLCQQTYIGQTRRKLHDRIREHTYAARKHDYTSAFGEHYANTHPNTTTPNITFKILKRTSDTLRLHIEEAYAIQTKSPQLNRRDEHLGMGFLI